MAEEKEHMLLFADRPKVWNSMVFTWLYIEAAFNERTEISPVS